jgi:alkylation response protein AidB-like acyl-CoA dehydrogenase
MLELTATTEAGARLVALAERLADALASRAAVHDREATFPHASVDVLKRAGYFAAPIPVACGGLGAESVHDIAVASSRLARGDASVAIGVNMHLAFLLTVVRRWRAAVAAGRHSRAEAFAATMREIVREGTIVSSAVSEHGQDLTHPRTTATRTATGWRIDGRKAFCTMVPAATVISTAVTFVDEDGRERYGYAQVPAGTAGVEIHDDWDALGMRASGSHSVTFDGAEVPATALRGGFATGDARAYMERNIVAGVLHAAASLGIAEAAAKTAAASVARRDEPAPRAVAMVAENAIELGACRATLARAASLIDAAAAETTTLFAEAQAAKAFLNETAPRIVDRALALSGGAGYLNGHPLARATRDVRAGGFMHPLGANRALELVGDVALGREPALV